MPTTQTQPTRDVCPHCGQDVERVSFELKGRRFDVPGMCTCPGAIAEREAAKASKARREAESRRAALDAKMRASGIPERYIRAEHPRAAAVADGIEDGRGWYIVGGQGTGKTHLAMAAARVLIARGEKVAVRVAPDMMEAMRSRAVDDRGESELLASVPVLVLDDLGKESPTAYACERLFAIVNARYNALLPTIVTSNFRRGDIAARLSEGEVGRSIASRLAQTTRTIRLEGGDRRLGNGA